MWPPSDAWTKDVHLDCSLSLAARVSLLPIKDLFCLILSLGKYILGFIALG